MHLVIEAKFPAVCADDGQDDEIVLLLEHDTEWGRQFSAWLMSWGVDVVIGPHSYIACTSPLLVTSPLGFASELVRRRLRVARALLPKAQLVLVTSPTDGIWPRPDCMTDAVDLRELLRRVGVGFVSEACA